MGKMATVVLLGLVAVGIIAFLGGFFVWLLWPVALPAAFPGLVSRGILAGELSFWQSVALTWLSAILFGRVTSHNK